MDENMDQIVESIKERGVITPITLRQKEDGRYELVSGHRRKKACKIADFTTIKAEIRDLSRDEAIILMVESNLQRTVILPSEKAFSYKMRLEAMKRPAGRTPKDNSGPVIQNFSRDNLGDSAGESGRQISRYIRLTELIPQILDMVDEGRITFRPAVEISYLPKSEQEVLLEAMSFTDATPSVLTDAVIPVTIAEDGVVLEIQLNNTRIRGNVQLTKVDANYPDNRPEQSLNCMQTSMKMESWISEDELLGMLTELTDGVYQTNDLLYGSYLVKVKTAPVGFYLDPHAYAFQIIENGVTVIVENEAGKGFINNAQTGSIRIDKTSEDKIVKGLTFKVEGTDITGQPFSKEYVTDANGKIHIEGLRVGDYVISEVANEATEKYELPPDVTVTVLEGKTTVAKFHNKLIPEIPDVPKTSDESNTGLWGALALSSLAGAGVTAYLAFGKKHRKENK